MSWYLLAAFLSGYEGESLKLYLAAARRPEFMSYRRFLRGGHLIDIQWLVDYIFDALSELPIRLSNQSSLFLVTTTNVTTGRAHFVACNGGSLKTALQASTSLPLLNRHFPLIEGEPHTDGGIAANIPIQEAIARGARRIMVIRARPDSYVKTDSLFHRLIRLKLRAHPELVATMRQRVLRHRQTVELLQSPPPGVEIIDISPPEQFGAGRFSRSPRQLRQGYQLGLAASKEAMAQWREAFSHRPPP